MMNKNHIRRNQGYSLMEVTLVIMVLAVILISILPIIAEFQRVDQMRKTIKHVNAIESALQLHVNTKGRLPCPADVTTGIDDSGFGVEGGSASADCSTGTPSANWSNADTHGGMVPVKTLQLPDEYAFDGWGQRIAYHVDRRLTSKYGFYTPTCRGESTVNDRNDTARTSTASFVLVSHGENGHGGFGISGVRKGAASTNAGELDNCDCNTSAASTGYDRTFYQSREYFDTPGNIKTRFDDVVRYKEKYQLFPIGPFTMTSVSTGLSHTCGLGNNNRAYCWGTGTYGKLGNNDNSTNHSTPVQVLHPDGISKFVDIAASDYSTCAITADGDGYCWGRDNWGQLGNGGSNTDSAIPVPVTMPGGVSFTQITAGGGHACALGNDNEAYCWGYGTRGQLGNSGTSSATTPVQVTRPGAVASWKKLSSGVHYSCGIANTDQVYCWGGPANGRLGNGSTSGNQPTPVPTLLPGGGSISYFDVASGGGTGCALGDNGNAYCWGQGTSGQIGDGSAFDRPTPVVVAMPSVIFTAIDTSWQNTCAVGDDGSAWCWGSGANGQIGEGGTSSRNVPTQVTLPAGTTAFTSITVGNRYACASNENGRAFCWGWGDSGRLGNSGTTDQTVPDAVSDPLCNM